MTKDWFTMRAYFKAGQFVDPSFCGGLLLQCW
jgi:hypothetical protein